MLSNCLSELRASVVNYEYTLFIIIQREKITHEVYFLEKTICWKALACITL